eukprot:5509506-Pyramimonas_sp.AAC.1
MCKAVRHAQNVTRHKHAEGMVLLRAQEHLRANRELPRLPAINKPTPLEPRLTADTVEQNIAGCGPLLAMRGG